MSPTPRVVVVTRPTEYDELLATHGTRGQAAFFLSTRGRDIAELEERHQLTHRAIEAAVAAIPVDWRRGVVERTDVARFLFSPDDVVMVVGQDGLVANVAKYRVCSSPTPPATSRNCCGQAIRSPSAPWSKPGSTTASTCSH